jgi:hypothetical protein
VSSLFGTLSTIVQINNNPTNVFLTYSVEVKWGDNSGRGLFSVLLDPSQGPITFGSFVTINPIASAYSGTNIWLQATANITAPVVVQGVTLTNVQVCVYLII